MLGKLSDIGILYDIIITFKILTMVIKTRNIKCINNINNV